MKNNACFRFLYMVAICLPSLLPGFPLPVLHAQTTANSSTAAYETQLDAAARAGDAALCASICEAWYASGQFIPGMLNWNYNALMSVDQGAIIITQNEYDTYPALLLQNALHVRKDVLILHHTWLKDPQVQQLLNDRLHLKPEVAVLDKTDVSQLLKFAQNEPVAAPLYFSVLVDQKNLAPAQHNLYITGLAIKYSPKPFDNVAVLRDKYENNFRVDYLKLNLESTQNQAVMARLNLNYIPAFLLLYRYYASVNNTNAAENIQKMAFDLARAGDRLAATQALFNQIPADALVSEITVKTLEKPMKKVGAQLYASETELTNAQYAAFLRDLVSNKEFDQLMECKTAKIDWRALLPENLRNLPDEVLFKHGHPDDPEAPVVNISRASAERYCAWITEVYNQSTVKKKFKKVVFRLPTENEWKIAGAGGIKEARFPWGGYYVRNSKGCYLGNYLVNETCDTCAVHTNNCNDGGFFPVPVSTYYPNNFGLYNVSGNVAEMVQEPGIVKGGSWNHLPYKGSLTYNTKYAGPDPAVGLRVFMEVIEE
jgi:formylglycine-generating enzyme required for sulfatase activity